MKNNQLMAEALWDKLAKGVAYTPEEQAVRDWVYANRKTFIDQAWTADEVALMACQVEVSTREAITSVLSYFNDALNGSHIDNRLAFAEYNFDAAMAQFHDMKAKLNAPQSLMPLWEDLAEYQTKGDK